MLNYLVCNFMLGVFIDIMTVANRGWCTLKPTLNKPLILNHTKCGLMRPTKRVQFQGFNGVLTIIYRYFLKFLQRLFISYIS